MLDTIEERIDRILQEKRELFDVIFSGAEGRRKLGLTQEELFGLFKLRCPPARSKWRREVPSFPCKAATSGRGAARSRIPRHQDYASAADDSSPPPAQCRWSE